MAFIGSLRLLPRASLAIPVDGFIVAGILNIAAQLCNLLVSAVKRGAGVKDSGTMLPGHGIGAFTLTVDTKPGRTFRCQSRYRET
ncbi:MAG TPA: phosphatidate cytidylyltransferase [Edaphobacter sp.]